MPHPDALRAAPRAARNQLEQTVLPFWLTHGIDAELGGFHTCFDNRGRELTSTDKFTWSQGRFVWLLARVADLARRGLLDVDPVPLLAAAERGAQFLLDHAVRADGTSVFRMRRDGEPAPEGPDRSVYADCFVVMGLAELARVTGDDRLLALAEPVLRRARRDIVDGTAPTPPYDVPPGYRAFGPRMILLNTLLVHAAAAREVRGSAERAPLAEALESLMAHRLPDGTFAEMIADADAQQLDGSLVARHRVPGHAVEGLWVALETMELLGDHQHRTAVLNSVPALCALGWDPELGGVLRYTDAAGPRRPGGASAGTAYEDLVARTWDTKLWWVHSEAAATTAIAAARYGSAPAAEWFDRIWTYTLATFPGRDDGEEWVQIRDRRGAPLDEVVALPVKDPFHIVRNLCQIVELGPALSASGEERVRVRSSPGE